MDGLLVRSLATWRISHLLLYEVGPYQILVKLRELVGVVHDEEGTPLEHKYQWTQCMWCFSIWVALVVKYLPVKVLDVFALSGAALLIGRIVDDGDSKT